MNTVKQVKKYLGWTLIILLLLDIQACSFVNEIRGAPVGQVAQGRNASSKTASNDHYANPSSYVVHGKRYYVLKSAKGYDKVGYASWYGTKFHGQHTSNHEAYDMYSMTGASTTLPIPSYVRVTNLANNQSVVVKINDRGPFRSDRLIDLSYGAAKKLGYASSGTARVRVTAVDSAGDSGSSFFASNQTADNVAPVATSHNKELRLADNAERSVSKKTKTTAHAADQSSLYLQVGSYNNRHKALGVSKQLASLTKSTVTVKEGYRNHSKVYRVHVGPLASNQSQVKKILAAHGFDDYIVIKG